MLQVHVWGSLSKNLWLSHHQLKDPSHMGKVNLFWYLETVSMCTTRQTQVRAGFCTARTGSRDWHLHSATCTGESKLTFLQQTKGQMDSCNTVPWKCGQTGEVGRAQVLSALPFQYLSYYQIWTAVQVKRDAFADTVWRLVPPATHCTVNPSRHFAASEEFLKINCLQREPQAQVQQFYFPVQVTKSETTSSVSA